MARPKLGTVTFQEFDLQLRQRERGVAGVALQTEEALVAGFDIVAEPDAATPPALTFMASRRSWLATRWGPWVGYCSE